MTTDQRQIYKRASGTSPLIHFFIKLALVITKKHLYGLYRKPVILIHTMKIKNGYAFCTQNCLDICHPQSTQ